MPSDTVDLEFLSRQAKQSIEETRALRKEVADIMRLVNASYELTRRVERRQSEMRDDLELTIKMELGGALANMQTVLDSSLARVEDQVGHVIERVERLELAP